MPPPTRRHRRILVGVGAAVLLYVSTPVGAAFGQAMMSGSVIDETTNQPIVSVNLRLIDDAGQVQATATSDNRGDFRLDARAAGTYTLSVRRIGYKSVAAENMNLALDEELQVEIRLNPSAVAVEAVTVIAERRPPRWLAELRRRAESNQRMGIGRVYLRADIERIQPHSINELMSTVAWGFGCNPTVLLDGLDTGGVPIHLTPEMIEAVEIYRGATQIPLEFQRYSRCGVALVWTRPDPPGARPLTWKRIAIAGLLVGLVGLLAAQ